MIETAIKPIQPQGDKSFSSFSQAKDFGKISEPRRSHEANSEKSGDRSSRGFRVEKQFSSTSTELAQAHSKFDKVLNFLEQSGHQPLIADNSNDKNFSRGNSNQAGLKLPSDKDDPVIYPKKNDEDLPVQLQLDLLPDEAQAPTIDLSPRLPSISTDIPLEINAGKLEQEPNIHIGNNPTNFKIQNIITNEIIKSLSSLDPNVKTSELNSQSAIQVANHVRKALSKQPLALAAKDNNNEAAIAIDRKV